MPHETGVRQRDLVGRRLALVDTEPLTKYILPFVDPTWRVPFLVVDRMGGPPLVLTGPVSVEPGRVRSAARKADLRPIESIPRDDFAALVHYDPWWAFRGVSGVDRPWVEAVFATNIAGTFARDGRRLKVHDLRFSSGLEKLEAVITKDETFRVVELGPSQVELLSLRRSPKGPARVHRAPPPPEGL